ncbi:AbrB/MazE/SpoVT family DNA-binding domain-containing protein [Candidatus Berkelbacteria bacterium]|nr:AbrB/MazE/SpoVT family DNA-binding domain-containing protein [Candidatus Berkelbacteria bacterium]
MRTAIQADNKVKLPSDIVKRLRWKPGSSVYVYPMEDGVALRSKPSKLLEAVKEFETIMKQERVTLNELIAE